MLVTARLVAGHNFPTLLLLRRMLVPVYLPIAVGYIDRG